MQRQPQLVAGSGDDIDYWNVLLVLLAGFIGGGAIAFVVGLDVLAGLRASLAGPDPKAYWYLARSTAFVAFGLLWISMALGVSITNRLARLWPGGPTAYAIHEYSSLLGLLFGVFHALILTGDHYTNFTLAQALIPFASSNYRPLWVGLGQVALYLSSLVTVTFYLRRQIGNRAWRLIHMLSFAVFALALVHGIWSGTDSAVGWVRDLYWWSGGSLALLTVYRVVVSARRSAPALRRSS